MFDLSQMRENIDSRTTCWYKYFAHVALLFSNNTLFVLSKILAAAVAIRTSVVQGETVKKGSFGY